MAQGHRKYFESVAAVALLMATPLAAQSTSSPPSPTPTPTPTPAPAPTNDVVGPPQLRDFNLNGAATQPVPPATTTPVPAPSPTPAPRPAAPVSEPRIAPAPATTTPAVRRPRPTTAAPDRDPARDAVTVDLPPVSAAPIVTGTPVAPPLAPAPAPVTLPPSNLGEQSTNWWPWAAALFVMVAGAAFFWRRHERERQRYAADNAQLGAMVAAPAAAPEAAPEPLHRAAPPAESPRPVPAPRPEPSPSPVPPPLQPQAAPPDLSGGIVAAGLKPKIELELVPIRAETDAGEGAALTVDIIILNRGSAPARDVLVEAMLINAGPQLDASVGHFFTQPPGTGDRVAVIPPMASVAVKLRLEVPGTALAPLVIEGRKLLVPVVAINAFYRWSGGEQTESSSFLVGRGEAKGGKMAPFRLDQGVRSWSGLAARLHSSGLQH